MPMNQNPPSAKDQCGCSGNAAFAVGTRLLLCACLLIFAACPIFAASPLLHKPAPAFSRSDFQHRKVDLRSYKGKVVLLDFWATWCAPCLVEIPHFTAWQKQYGPRGLQVVGVSMDDDPAAALKVYEKLKINYPVVMGDEKLGNSYGGVLGLPVAFLIDRMGVIQAQFQGETDLKIVEKQIIKLLGP